MPHTKRKGRVRQDASTPTRPGPIQTTLTGFYPPTTILTPECPITLGDIEQISTMSGEISLSPRVITTPPPPMGVAETHGLDSPLLRKAFLGESPIEEVYGGEDAAQELDQRAGAIGGSGVAPPIGPAPVQELSETPVKSLASSFKFDKNQKVSLEMLWTAIMALHHNVEKMSSNIRDVQSTLQNLSPLVTNNGLTLKKVETDIIQIKDVQSTIIKGETILSRKVENLENMIRYSNLRFVNFPRCRMVSPVEQLRNYFSEVLSLVSDNLPMIKSAYFLNMRDQNQNPNPLLQESPLNVTELIESSYSTQIEMRGTLIVKFALTSDRDKILNLFMKKRTSLYLGQKIWVYPDVTKDTQSRRKKFIALAGLARTFGIQINIKFPCKCLMKVDGTKYVYYNPLELERFLEERRSQDGVPESSN